MKQPVELKTEKGDGCCESELFPVKCPYDEEYLDDGIPLPINIGDIHCQTNLCGHFEGISADEQIVYCSNDKK